MFRCYLASVLLCVVVVYGQDCNQETDKYRQCLQQKRQEQQDAAAKEREASQAKMKDQLRQCFTSSGCKEPNFDQPSQGKGDSKGGWGKGKGTGGADFEKRRECSKQIEDKARASIEKCVQAKQPGFKFPTPDKNQQKQGGGAHKGGMGGSHFGNFGKTINDSCPTDDSRQKLKTCMKDSFQKGASSKGASQGEARFNQTCQGRDACFKAMPAQCQTQFNATKKATCDCAQQLLTSSKTQLDQEYNTCAGISNTVTTPSTAQNSGHGHRFGGFGQQHGSNLEMFVKRLCSDRDFCHGGGSKGGHGPFGGGHFGGGHFGGFGHGPTGGQGQH